MQGWWLQIDDNMMTELKEVQQTVKPTDTLLVVDSMTGQEAAGLVKAFNDAAPLTGDFSPRTTCTQHVLTEVSLSQSETGVMAHCLQAPF